MTPKTAAIVIVHISGFITPGVERLRRECRERGIKLIEDCAHAHGAKIGDKEAGALGDIGCHSFYPTKVITSGTGGMLTTNDAELAAYARSLRHHGQGASLEEIVHPGNDWLLDEVRAVVLAAQLARLDEFLTRRRAVAARYDALLASDARIRPSRPAAGTEPAYYKYPVTLPEGVSTANVRKRMMDEHNIEIGSLYWPPAHLMPVFKSYGAKLPVAEKLLARQICLPMHAALEPADADRSVEALRDVLRAG